MFTNRSIRTSIGNEGPSPGKYGTNLSAFFFLMSLAGCKTTAVFVASQSKHEESL
jgi:hypothetical protein